MPSLALTTCLHSSVSSLPCLALRPTLSRASPARPTSLPRARTPLHNTTPAFFPLPVRSPANPRPPVSSVHQRGAAQNTRAPTTMHQLHSFLRKCPLPRPRPLCSLAFLRIPSLPSESRNPTVARAADALPR
ncbi:hypothetical protein FKP32DRAFT_445161 [Trametes sanguinea]|nr:hypothetical protein FKP32DRAFT_445161 [Trametes sanguinea]